MREKFLRSNDMMVSAMLHAIGADNRLAKWHYGKWLFTPYRNYYSGRSAGFDAAIDLGFATAKKDGAGFVTYRVTEEGFRYLAATLDIVILKEDECLFSDPLTEEEAEVIRDFWSWVKEHDDEVMVTEDPYTQDLVLYMDIKYGGLSAFVDKYLPDSEYSIDCTISGDTASVYVLEQVLADLLDKHICYKDAWALRPEGLRECW